MSILYAKGSCWWLHHGSMEEAKEIKGSRSHQEFNGSLGPESLRAQKRPLNFNDLPGREQWAIDKRLGILDWDGKPES